MAVKMKLIAVISLLLTAICKIWHMVSLDNIALVLCITFGTTAYHFLMRLAVGYSVNGILHNHVNYRRKWFQVREKERKLYELLKVKKWKDKMPTYDAETFDVRLHSWEEMAEAMCQSEIVHEIIVLLSFVPIVASIWFGELGVFVITSILSAGFDSMFVIMQRYNRTRILKMIEKKEKKKC